MPILLLLLAGAGFYLWESKSTAVTGAPELINPDALDPVNKVWPDCLPQDQGGSFDTEYDDLFDQVSAESQVPFCLMKAHAIRESSLNKNAYHLDTNGHASYGLMQIEWWKGSNRFAKYGYPDDQIGDGSMLYDPLTNIRIASHIITENLNRFGNLRDAINAYNTGTSESKYEAPANYVDDVLKYYTELLGRSPL